jgi:3-oxoacyl-[acyl-carrier-protein] synthase-3
MEMPHAAILGIGAYAPERVMTNAELERMVDTSNEWIIERTGIEQRHVAAESEAASDLAVKAARDALEMANTRPEELDLIVCATVTGDMPFPSTACYVQAKLGAPQAAAFDVGAGCTGFLYGMHVVQHLIRAGAHRRVLLIGVEVLSRVLDWTDRATCVLLGDAAGAAVLGPAPGPGRGILATNIAADGWKGELLHLPAGGSLHPASHETIDAGMHYFKMNGRETFKHATRNMEEIAGKTLQDAGLSLGDVDLLVPHQANLRIISYVAKQLELPMEKVFTNVQRYGNTSSASIPLALTEAHRAGRVKEGQAILMVAFGAGLTWGAAALRW